MGIKILFYSLLILGTSLFSSVVASGATETINSKIRKKPEPKPVFSTSKWPSIRRKPTEVRQRLPRESWLRLGKIPRNTSSTKISPASSMDSRETTISALTQDSALSLPRREEIAERNANKQTAKVVPMDSDSIHSSHSDVSLGDSLAETQVNGHVDHESMSRAETEVVMPSAAVPVQMSIESHLQPKASSEEIYLVPQSKEAIERRRQNLYDALKEWHSDLATEMAKSVRLREEIDRLKLTYLKGEQKQRENELIECHEDIEWIQGHIARCKNELIKLPPKDMEEKPRSKARRDAVLLEVIN